jgi:hypothetical protein
VYVPGAGQQGPAPLIVITPGQQLQPQFLIHAVIQLPSRPAAEAPAQLGRHGLQKSRFL